MVGSPSSIANAKELGRVQENIRGAVGSFEGTRKSAGTVLTSSILLNTEAVLV
jgi:hypothetical protein